MKQLSLNKGGPGEGQGSVTVEGVLERFTFNNPENGWCVARLKGEGGKGGFTAVGHLPGAQPGETLRLTGSWIEDRKWGRQLKVETFMTVTPSTLVGMERYLGSGMVDGIGPELARRLVDHFGLDAFDIIERQPERLTEVDGIGPKRRALIGAAWVEQRAIKEVMVFLQGHGVTTALAVKIYKRYGDRAVALLNENPYRLSVDIFGVGFKTADRIALNLGLSPSSPERAAAGLLHVLDSRAGDGHMYCPREELLSDASEILSMERAVLELSLGTLVEEQHVVAEAAGGVELYYLAWLFDAEQGAARRLSALLGSTAQDPETEGETEAELERFEQRAGVALAVQQREAVRAAAGGQSLVITGGPGTGKTTLVRAILEVAEAQGRRALLCAPTGRAAKRLAEATGREAATVHRLLEFDPRERRFVRDEEYPLAAHMIIVDEVSMVDALLFHAILKAAPSGCQLVLVGDVDQLPSVGPGSVLSELIRSGAVAVVRLTEIFRQAQESLIVVNAHRVNAGQLPRTDPPAGANEGALPDFFFIERQEPEDVLAVIKQVVAERLPRRFGVDPKNDVQVLTPMHRGILGDRNLNVELQALLNPRGEVLARGGRDFRVGDKVMQLRNNYDLDVFNGDIGRIEALDEVERQVMVRVDGRRVTYEYSDLDELVLGYACSIHKSQGSEYPVVVIPLHTQHYTMLQRNLLYTAITRGKQVVVLVGSSKAVGIAVRNDRLRQRNTRLGDLLTTM